MRAKILERARYVDWLIGLARHSARDAGASNDYTGQTRWQERANRLYRAWLRLQAAATKED